jgi:uncharacterized membrane-anchored protein
MQRKPILITAFILMVLAQLYVPADMIFSRQRVLHEGVSLKFRTAPVDPYDPFRGKYIFLSFPDNVAAVAADQAFNSGDEVYVTFGTDDQGYAVITHVYEQKPEDRDDYLKTTVGYHSMQDSIRINFPFDRFYMEESKAYEAELAYGDAQRDAYQEASAIVSIYKGEAVLSEVMINGKPIREVAIERLKENE